MNLKPFLDLLQTLGVGTQGQNLFLNNIPASVDSAVMLRNRPSGVPIDYEIPGYFKGAFQMIVRHSDQIQGQAVAENAARAMTMDGNLNVSGIRLRYLRPRHLPIAYPVSEGGYWEFSVTLDVAFDIL